MKIKDGFVVRKIADQSVVIALGSATKDFNGIIRLNETGRIIWDMLSEGKQCDDIVKAITERYDIDSETAEKDVEAFINKLQGANILE